MNIQSRNPTDIGVADDGPRNRASQRTTWARSTDPNPPSPSNDGCDPNSQERTYPDPGRQRRRKKDLRNVDVATWNVRTLNQLGKIEQVKNECERLNIDILGIAEARMTGTGNTKIDSWLLSHSGGDRHEKGVGFLFSPEAQKKITEVVPINDRMIRTRLEAKPQHINIIQVYMPTTAEEDDVIRGHYHRLTEEVNKIPSKERVVIMGDFNAKIGSGTEHPACGKFGLGEQNERGEMLLDWMNDNGLIAVNTCFQHREKERYTWASPGGDYHNMIDYVMIRRRSLTECQDSRALVSADCGSDHQMVWAKITGRLWNSKKSAKSAPKYQLKALKARSAQYEESVRRKLDENAEEEITWNRLKTALLEKMEEVCPRTRVARKPWIDEECLQLIEERREMKKRHGHQSVEYRRLCKAVKRDTRRSKREWMEEKAQEAQEAYNRNNTKDTYRLVKELAGQKRTGAGLGIKNKDGQLLYGKTEVKNRWHEYCTELFSDPVQRTQPDITIDDENREPEVLMSEIHRAIKRLKDGKAAGADNLPAEALKAAGDTAAVAMKRIIDRIWNTGEWPEDWTTSELIALPKVAGTQDCAKHRTLSLISHASKILLEIIRQRLTGHIQSEMAEEQFGFVRGKGTTDAIIVMRNVIEKTRARQDQELWMLFIDYSKAFDTVYHPKLWDALLNLGASKHIIWLLKNLYQKAVGVMRVEDETTEPFEFQKGVRQGCLVSPLAFIAVGEVIMRITEEKCTRIQEGYKAGGRNIWNIRYADDTTLLAKSREALAEMAEELRKASLDYGLKINSAKTNVMKIGGQGKVQLDGEDIEDVHRVKFLGSMLTTDGDSRTEIKKRLAMAKTNAIKMSRVWETRELNLTLKKTLARSLIWSIALYACESWTLKKEDEQKVTSFEMWLWRRVLGITWQQHRTNVSVREEIGVPENRGLLAEMKRRKQSKYAHWKRRGSSLLLAAVEGEPPGRLRRGRRRIEWPDNIRDWTDGGMDAAARAARDRRRAPTVPTDYG